MKVICIRDNWHKHGDITYPVKGIIYTVRGTRKNRPPHEIRDGYLFEEIHNPVMDWLTGFEEASFDIHCFRPITDISALVELTKVRELEDA